MTALAYPCGLDCVWIASDCDGHLGAFVTGGVGPIPVLALSSEALPIEDVEEEVCRLPQVSDTRLLVSINRPDDFISMAERGFFVYDWRDVHRTMGESTHTYELVSAPLNPITIDALPEVLRGLAMDVKFGNLALVERRALDVGEQFECVSGE